jgi:hypothetical protein
MITFVALFEANGLLTTSVNVYNLKKNYYIGVYGAFRLFCEICFTLLLLFYLLIELNEIRGKINSYKKEKENLSKTDEKIGC